MAIYTTELITDRDYNIPEGRLPLEYAVDQANKAKTHSENAEVHVTAEERAAWNASGGGNTYRLRFIIQEDLTAKLAIPAEAPTGFYLLHNIYRVLTYMHGAWMSKITSWRSDYITLHTDKNPYGTSDLVAAVNNGEQLVHVDPPIVEHTSGNETIIAQTTSEAELASGEKRFYWSATYYRSGDSLWPYIYATHSCKGTEF